MQKRVLVVEDNSMVRGMLKMALERRKYHVHTAGDGIEALRSLDRCTPDVVVTDLRMPNLDGIGLLGEMEQLGFRIPVIVCRQ